MTSFRPPRGCSRPVRPALAAAARYELLRPEPVAVAAPRQTRCAAPNTMVECRPGLGEEYTKVQPAVGVEVSGGGSGVGIAALGTGHHRHANRKPQHEARRIDQAGRTPARSPESSSSATTRSPSS